MSGSKLLQENSGRLKTRMGAFFAGSHAVFRGHDLHTDLKNMDWLELFVLGITGRRFTPEQIRMLHALWVNTSYPDARLWNNRVAALSGTARSTGALGLAAAIAVSEAKIYGLGPCIGAYDFFVRAHSKLEQGIPLSVAVQEELRIHRRIGGFGRPITSADERLAPIISVVNETGLDQGTYFKLAFEVNEVLDRGRWRLKINYAAITAALVLDMGFSRQEYYLYMTQVFLAGMPPCFIEATQHPEGTLFPLSCQQILYQGRSRRPWPKPNPQGQKES